MLVLEKRGGREEGGIRGRERDEEEVHTAMDSLITEVLKEIYILNQRKKTNNK